MKKTYYLLTFILLVSLSCKDLNNNVIDQNEFYVVSWNLENLFDTNDNPEKDDNWFLPSSEINWTQERLKQKVKNQAEVISFMNNSFGPDILGVQEVENESLLLMILDQLKLEKDYKIIYRESLDNRGIDNALIYNSILFKEIKTEALEVDLGNGKSTRDILYTVLDYHGSEIHVFVNHWPSRRAGLKETEGYRIKAAERLMNKIGEFDNLLESNIIILGDFNDLPANISLNKILKAQILNCDSTYNNGFSLYNLSYNEFKKGNGSYKFRDHWNMLDQIIISNTMLNNSIFKYDCDSFEVLKPEFIIQQSGKYQGTPLPTYGGRKYLGGYSDHFPVGANFIKKK